MPIEMEQDLGVAARVEHGATRLKVPTPPRETVDFAIEGNDDVSAGHRHRLPAAVDVDQRQPGMEETRVASGILPCDHVVRSAMQDGLQHGQRALRIRPAISATDYLSGKSAHCSSKLTVRGARKGR